MLMLRFACLCAPCHVYVWIYIFECSLSCSCVQIYMLIAMPCASKAFFVSCYAFFLCFCPFKQDVDLDLVVQAYIHTPRPISKGLDHFLCAFLCLLASFFALSPCLPVQIQGLPCFMLSVGLCLSVLGAICLRGCIHPSCGLLDVTTCETHIRDVDVLDTHLSPLRTMLSCLPHLLCATHLAFFASSHLCTLAYMFMHESVCLPYSNPIELWTLNPNLHLSSQDTFFSFDNMLFAPVWLSLLLIVFFQHALFLLISLLVCWLVSFVIACTRVEHGHLEQGCDLLDASKKGKDASKKT